MKKFNKNSNPQHKKFSKSKNSSSNLVIGRNCVSEILKNKPKTIKKLFLTSQSEGYFHDLIESCNFEISIELLEKEDLTSLANSDSHQGVGATIEYDNFVDLKELIKRLNEKDHFIVLALDEITDPQNFGSIVRAAECFGVDAIVYSVNRGSPLTPALSKASVGAIALVSLCKVNNLAQSLLRIREETISWLIVADSGEDTESLFSFDFPNKSIIVMGSEGEGVQDLIQRKSDYRVTIPMFGKIDSINVSQASAVMLSFYRKSCNSSSYPP